MKPSTLICLASLVIITACTHFNNDYSSETLLDTATNDIALDVGQQWQTPIDMIGEISTTPWVSSFGDSSLSEYVKQAINHNWDLKIQASTLARVIESVNVSRSQRLPSVDANLQQSYSKADGQDSVITYSPSLNLSWEVDLWQRLSDQKKSSLLSAEAQQATYEAARLSLAANIAKRWFAINADQLLIQINNKRLSNQESALAIVEEQYKSGRGAAMDIFLSRSDVSSQRATILNARNELEQSIRSFKRLLGEYPDIGLDFIADLPELTENIPVGVPSDLLLRRPDIIASMNQWQASMLEVGIADKARFPSFSLTASYGASSDELLSISASDFVFNLVNNVTMPLFNAGRLSSQLKQAELTAQAHYQAYVDTLLTSFEEVESALGAESALKKQLVLLEESENFARSAYELAFEQYQAGLIRYSNLLDFEQRWFNAQADIITVKNSRLQNRVNLYLALGGDF